MDDATRQLLDTLQPYRNTKLGANRYNTPWRLNDDGPADGGTLAVETDPAYGLGLKWFDHKDGKAGNGWTLAKLLNIQIGGKPAAKESPYQSLADYAHTHGVDVSVFTDAGWVETKHGGFLCFRFKTATGHRYRYADPALAGSKYKSEPGYTNCWYGLERAVKLAGSGPIILCNGEPSTVAAQHHNVPACCVTGGEKGRMPQPLIDQLKSVWSGKVLIAFDCDVPGRKAGRELATSLRSAGIDAHAVDLQGSDGYDVADFCRLHNGSSAGAILSLPILMDVEYATGEIVTTNTFESYLAKAVDQSGFAIPISAADLGMKKIPETNYFIQDMLRPGFAMFVGNSGIGKTPALIQLALAFATGNPWLGSVAVRKCRVLYIGVEYDESYIKETAIASYGSSELPNTLFFLSAESFTTPKTEEESLAMLQYYMDTLQVEVIIIDVFSGFLPREKFKQDKYRGDYAEFLMYQKLFLFRKALLVGSWHGGKHAKDPETAYNGGQGMWGSAGGGRLTMIFDDENQVRFRSQLRGHERKEWVLEQARIGGAHFWAVVDADPDPIFGSDAQRRIYAAVKQHSTPREPLTPQGVKAILTADAPELGLKDSYIRQTLSRLEERGFLNKWNGGYIISREIRGSAGSRGSDGSGEVLGSDGSDGSLTKDNAYESDPSDPSRSKPLDRAASLPNASNSAPIQAIQQNQRSNDFTPDPPDFWSNVPTAQRTILRLYLRSNKESDQAQAQELCTQYQIDYEQARQKVKEQP